MTTMNVSIGIAAAITAYARIHMTEFLQDSSYNVYYTVTDSPINNEHTSLLHLFICKEND